MGEAKRQQRDRPLRLLFALLFGIAVAALSLAGRLPPQVPPVCLAASVASFALYALDKRAAVNNRRRVSESTLHLLGLLGGWPGAALAQGTLRHKTQKRTFLFLFRVTALLNCVLLALLAAGRP